MLVLDTKFIVSSVFLTSCSAHRCTAACEPPGYFWSQRAIPWRSAFARMRTPEHPGQSWLWPLRVSSSISSAQLLLLTWTNLSQKWAGRQILQMNFIQRTPQTVGLFVYDFFKQSSQGASRNTEEHKASTSTKYIHKYIKRWNVMKCYR